MGVKCQLVIEFVGIGQYVVLKPLLQSRLIKLSISKVPDYAVLPRNVDVVRVAAIMRQLERPAAAATPIAWS